MTDKDERSPYDDGFDIFRKLASGRLTQGFSEIVDEAANMGVNPGTALAIIASSYASAIAACINKTNETLGPIEAVKLTEMVKQAIVERIR